MNMMKSLFLPMILVVLIGSLFSSAVIAAPVPVAIDSVEIDGFGLSVGELNIRDLERGESFDVKVRLRAAADAQNVEIRAFVSGFEFSRTEDISDSTSPFDVEANTSYVKTLELKLPERADEDKYRITVVVAGRDTDLVTQNYRIKVTPTDHEVVIRDLSVNPEEIQPGRAVLATVRVKNLGNSNENDVRIRVAIPELGVSAEGGPDYIDDLESEESRTSDDFILRIPACAKEGTYDVVAEVTFEEGDSVVTASKEITVTKGGSCNAGTPSSVSAGVVKIYAPEPQNVEAGSSASYAITIKNEGSTTKTFSLSASNADWASVKFSTPVAMVKGGESQVVYATVTPNKGVDGGRTLVVKVKDQGGDVVGEVSVASNVTGSSSADMQSLVQLLQVGLIALIVVLVVVGLVVAFRRMKGPKEGEEGTQTYY